MSVQVQDEEGYVTAGGLRWRTWATLPIPSDRECAVLVSKVGQDALVQMHGDHHAAIAREELDPLRFGWESPCNRTVRELLEGTYVPGRIGTAAVSGFTMKGKANDVLALGGNGSGKTRFAAKLGMEVLTRRPKKEIRCYSQNEQTSIRYQQTALHAHLQPELRKV